jgi:hypothetical protein
LVWIQCRLFPLSRSKTRMVLSKLPVTNCLPVGE